MHSRFDNVWVAVFTFIEYAADVDRYAHDVIALGDSIDIDPLTNELLVVPVAPPAGDSLEIAVIVRALVAAVFERVLEAEALLVAGRHDVPVPAHKFVTGESADVIVAVAFGEIEVGRVGI